MRSKITIKMLICQAGNGFFWDELEKKLAEAFADHQNSNAVIGIINS